MYFLIFALAPLSFIGCTSAEGECPQGEFYCRDPHYCLGGGVECDGIKDCFDGQDELCCMYHSAYACDGETLTGQCDPGKVIQVVNGNYGRTNDYFCGYVPKTRCLDFDVRKIFQRECDNRTMCTVRSTVKDFRETCEGKPKFLEMHYLCVDPPPKARINEEL